MNDPERSDRRVKIWLLAVSVATIVLLGAAALQENLFAEWRGHRAAYATLLEARATDDVGRAAAREFDVHVVQHFVPELDAVDRCTTCHAGVEDPRMRTEPQPYRTHPGRYLEVHDPAKFGCTACHEGQGRALVTADAHGTVAHWERPMLAREHRKTACSKCHGDAELYGAGGALDRLDDGESVASAPLVRGRRLLTAQGCLGCHVLGGKGGALGPDLSTVGDKVPHDFDFTHLGRATARTVPVWLRRHFLAPGEVSPGSVMPAVDADEAEPLTAYMLSRRAPIGGITPAEAGQEGEAASGAELYGRYCSACHGGDGTGGSVPDMRTPSLANRDFQAVVSDDFLRFVIENGRAHGDMPAWGPGRGNLTRDEIDRIVAHLRRSRPRGPRLTEVSARAGDAVRGRAYYRGFCAGCHGPAGEGGVGTRLASPAFLAIADDRFLARSIVYGRPGTAMPAWRHLSSQAVSDLLAYMRTWQPTPPTYAQVATSMAATDRATNVRIGATLFRDLCGSCHGPQGRGGFGPSLTTPDLLGLVDDRALYQAIVHGRPTTAMPAWAHLRAEDVGALIAYVRSFQPRQPIALGASVPVGDAGVGEVYYRAVCQQCHGEGGSGGVGPQLANPVFQASVSDQALFHWIAYGRAGTAMKGFLEGQQGVASLTSRQISDVIAYLRVLGATEDPVVQRRGLGNAAFGATLYAGQCASCHGANGEGASGPQLANPAFLEAVSDGFLAATIVLGREGTAMRSMVIGRSGLGQLEPEHVVDLIAFMRQWEYPRTWRRVRRIAETSQRAVASGQTLYAHNCEGCHGPKGRGRRDGEGYYAPALNDPTFLDAASDGFLLATIAEGRAETPMRPFGSGAGGIGALAADEISDIVAFIRSWQQAAATGVGG